jgi:hypothetical protein
VLHSRVGSWPHPQILDLAGKACQGQNTLAYYKNPYTLTVKYVIVQALGDNSLKKIFQKFKSNCKIVHRNERAQLIKTSNYFAKFCDIESRGQCYKTFSVRNLRIFVIS